MKPERNARCRAADGSPLRLRQKQLLVMLFVEQIIAIRDIAFG